jgi:hypothetical protein
LALDVDDSKYQRGRIRQSGYFHGRNDPTHRCQRHRIALFVQSKNDKLGVYSHLASGPDEKARKNEKPTPVFPR